MKGLWVADGEVRVRGDLAEPEPLEGEVRVAVTSAGVCATDLALVRGYMGFRGVPGHEFVGVAREGRHAGRRVVGEINAACGECAACLGGLDRHCPNRSVLGILGRTGAFAETLVLPERNLHPVPDELPTALATFAEPAAAAYEVLEQVDVAGLGRALVVGDGRLGLLCAQVLALTGLEVDLAGRHPERGDWLPDGVRHLGGAEPDGSYPLVLEATGRSAAVGAALDRVAPRGTLVLKTTTEERSELDLARLVVDEITLVGSRCGPFEPALRALASGELRVEPMLAGRFPLDEGPEALERAGRSGVLKILIDVNPDDAD